MLDSLDKIDRSLKRLDKWLPPRNSDRPNELQKKSATSLLDFTCHVNPRYKPSWFHRAICNIFDQVIRGEKRRVILSLPPRHGKSELASRQLPSYLLGLNPDAQVIATSYSSDLASKNNRSVQRIIDTQLYRSLFSKTTLSGKNARNSAQFNYLRNSDEFEIVNHRGSYRSAGVGGGITGMGFGGEMTTDLYGKPCVGGIGIIDDYFKNRAEADSPTVREGVWDWYTSTFRTRCEDNAPIIVIATQWHEDGLIGRLIANAKADSRADQWEVIRFPAIAISGLSPYDEREIGQALWESKYPLPELEKVRASIGKRDWEALYQQNPTPTGGNLFKLREWNLYADIPDDISQHIISVDASFKDKKTSDFVVVGVIAQQFNNEQLEDGSVLPLNNYYIPYLWRDQAGISRTEQAIKDAYSMWPQCNKKLIEDKANGSAIIERLSGQLSGIEPYNPGNNSKLARATAVQPIHERGGMLLPLAPWAAEQVKAMGRNTITLGEWWELHPPAHDKNAEHAPVPEWCKELMDESSDFPSGKYDDQVDMFTQALNWLPKTRFDIAVEAAANRLSILS